MHVPSIVYEAKREGQRADQLSSTPQKERERERDLNTFLCSSQKLLRCTTPSVRESPQNKYPVRGHLTATSTHCHAPALFRTNPTVTKYSGWTYQLKPNYDPVKVSSPTRVSLCDRKTPQGQMNTNQFINQTSTWWKKYCDPAQSLSFPSAWAGKTKKFPDPALRVLASSQTMKSPEAFVVASSWIKRTASVFDYDVLVY